MQKKQQNLSGWGLYPVQPTTIHIPETAEEIKRMLNNSPVIPFGVGRSYGDTALGEHVIQLSNMKRFTIDPIHQTVTADGGVTFDELLQGIVPKGLFLPVTPGTKFVTVGGAIANDIHGKNHHRDGSLAEYVQSFSLLIASGEILTCSRTENRDLFFATIGGIGLTGIILEATIQLIPIETSGITVTYHKTKNVYETLELFEANKDVHYSVAWIDCVSTGEQLGRSVLMLGEHTPLSEIKKKSFPLQTKKGMTFTLPFYLPAFALNEYSIKAFNAVYYHKHKNETTQIHYEPFFYPLDMVHDWNKGYGKKGFIQYQFTVPFEEKEALISILKKLAEYKKTSFLAVLKTFGKASGGLLSFPEEGYTLALDISVRPGLESLTKELDEMVLKAKGKIYLAKDAMMTAETFQQMYGETDTFLRIKNDIDPICVFRSAMSKRLGLTN